jgi:hypothetical protein
MNDRRPGQGRAAEPASRPRRRLPEVLKAYQFKPGQSGNPRGGNNLQTFRAQLAKLDPVVIKAMERILKEDTKLNDATWRFIMRMYVRLRYPEEYKAGMAEAVVGALPASFNQLSPSTPEVQELKRVMIDAVAAYAKQKEVANGAAQPPALPNGGLES